MCPLLFDGNEQAHLFSQNSLSQEILSGLAVLIVLSGTQAQHSVASKKAEVTQITQTYLQVFPTFDEITT